MQRPKSKLHLFDAKLFSGKTEVTLKFKGIHCFYWNIKVQEHTAQKGVHFGLCLVQMPHLTVHYVDNGPAPPHMLLNNEEVEIGQWP